MPKTSGFLLSKDAVLTCRDLVLISWRGATYPSWPHLIRAHPEQEMRLEAQQRTAVSGVVSVRCKKSVEFYAIAAEGGGYRIANVPLAAFRGLTDSTA